MITQSLLDWLSQLMAGIVSTIPPLPGSTGTLITEVESAVEQFAQTAAYLSPLVPYDVFPVLLSYWGGLMLVWSGYLALRLALWVINR